MHHPAQNFHSWTRLFIIDLMASTWKRDNQALFPVKQSCCFSSRNRKTQQQHASSFSYRVILGIVEAENRTWDVWCAVPRDCCEDFVYVQINKAIHYVCVITDKSCPNPLFAYSDEASSSDVAWWVFAFDFSVSLDFPFHYLLIWKTKWVTDKDEERTMFCLQCPSHHYMEKELSTTPHFWVIV